MGAKARYSQFDNLTAAEVARLLNLSKLSREDKEIAAQCIVWRMDYADVGEYVHMDRRTVARKMQKDILPELERMMERMKAGA